MLSCQDVELRRAAEAAKQRQIEGERAAARAPARALAATLLARGWRIGRPQISIGAAPSVLLQAWSPQLRKRGFPPTKRIAGDFLG